MDRIKVAIILPYFGTGGAEKMVAQLAANMDTTEFDVKVFCILGGPLDNHLEKIVAENGVAIQFIGKKLGFSFSAIFKLFGALDAFNPDVVHTHQYACLYTFLWPALRRKPFLHTFHLPPELENRRLIRRIISKILIWLKIMSPVAISHENRKFLSRYYGLPEPVIPVVYNPVELSRFEGLTPEKDSDFTFITAGRFSAQKNHKLMLLAFSEFLNKGYDAKLVLLGKGEEENSLKILVQDLGINDRVCFPGFVVNVEEYLTNADVFLLSSDYEALPLALLEAMAAGLPIISTDVGGVRDIVTNNGILFRAKDLAGMIQAMEKLYLENELREQMAAASSKNVHSYDVSNTVSGYSQLYRHYASIKQVRMHEI